MTDDLLTRLDDAANDTHYIDHETAREASARQDALEEAAKVADDHTPEKHSGMTLASHVTGRTIAAAIRAIAAGGAK